MDKIKIEGIPPYDGEYDLDVSYFTNRELHVIKKMSGVRAGELLESFQAGDTDLVVALASIALTRAGQTVVPDALWDAPSGSISFIGEEEEVPPTEAQKQPDSDAKPSEQSGSSGPHLNDASDLPESDQSPTGLLDSELSAA